MTDLSDGVLRELAGGDVSTVAAAQDVPVVTAADVEAARLAAEKAEQTAAESERRAVLGEVGDGQAVSDRQAATFARLRASLTARKAERHQAAERIRQLATVGADAVVHAGELKGLRDRIVERQAKIAELQSANHDDITGWTAGLADIAARGHELQPEPVPPSGQPHASSAHVWAGTIDTRPRVNVHGRVISGIRLDHPHGIDTALDEADVTLGRHDLSERLYVAENGLVQPLGRDAGGHIARKIAAGQLRELGLAEKQAYWRGEHS